MSTWRAFWHGFLLALGIHHPQWSLNHTFDGSYHVVPLEDSIGHEQEDCVCGPDIEPCPRGDGSMGWLVIHHSLDGREASE